MKSAAGRLLAYLRENQGQWISGQAVSKKMAVSRSAVWKQISRLKERGYVIESSPRKGYLLVSASDMLIPDEVREGLHTGILGKGEVLHFMEIGSTNSLALEMAAAGAAEGTLVISETQTQGRGRRGREWYSPSGENIYASLILRPGITPVEAPKISLMAAVALAEALLAAASPKVRIKWPNDILIQNKKAAGILTEIATELDSVNYMVIGMGINVNSLRYPARLKGQATSLRIETGSILSRVGVLQGILTHMERYYEALKAGGFTPVIDRWRELTDMIGRQVRVRTINSVCSGMVRDLAPDGALLLQDHAGRVQRVYSGDVEKIQDRSAA